MAPSWLGSFILALAFLVFFYTPGPGRRLRHWVVGCSQSGRVIGLTKVKMMDPDFQVAQLRTPTATLEIAIAPSASAEEVLMRLRVPDKLQP